MLGGINYLLIINSIIVVLRHLLFAVINKFINFRYCNFNCMSQVRATI
ncbi:hypothetical protein FDUTEX481_06531 [Tolypothrix sp. PCC 7601]|nr:hypothetical protein FDUTEX481_06531 [Tolypothrix sp. PCC 7601]